MSKNKEFTKKVNAFSILFSNSLSPFSNLSKVFCSFISSLIKTQDLRQIIYLKVSLFILFLSLVVIKAPWEKKDSILAKVVGIAKYLLAIIANKGYLFLSIPQKLRGLVC